LPKPNSPRYLSDWFEQYAREHYEKIGVVGFDAGGKLVSTWGEASNLPPALPPEHITIFRRRTDLHSPVIH
jgi:hypothetical protein